MPLKLYFSHKKVHIMKKHTFSQKMTIVDVLGDLKHYVACKETFECDGIKLKFTPFELFRFSLYQNYIFLIVLWFIYHTRLLFRHQILTVIMLSTILIKNLDLDSQAWKHIGFLLAVFTVKDFRASQCKSDFHLFRLSKSQSSLWF